MHFEDDKYIVWDREHGESVCYHMCTLENGLFVLDMYDRDENAFMTNVDNAHVANEFTWPMHDAELRHARFGHVNYDSLLLL